MLVYNTLTNKKEPLPKTGGHLNLFVCGPTVYDLAHLGHARTYIAFDMIVRYLRSLKYEIFYLQNITDIDDKIIDRAKQEKIDPKKLARQFEREYLKDMKALRVESVDTYARASAYIKEIQNQIERLLLRGYAYQIKSGVYFEVKKFRDYGKLSRQNLEELQRGVRIEPDPEKKNALDFALWKRSEEKPNWESPWGEGRPGWHIEDTAITEKVFGDPQYDLHGGGVDLKFPHHECEIAQSEAISGRKPFVKIWMHTGHLLVGGQKMSKSLGNFITIRDFLRRYPPNVLRYLVLSHHYRAPFDYQETAATQAENALMHLEIAVKRISFVKTRTKASIPTEEPALLKHEDAFHAAMRDDFNTPEAFAALFGFIHELQQDLFTLTRKQAASVEAFLKSAFELLGIELSAKKLPTRVEILGKERDSLRARQQFIQADALRKKIETLGYKVEDTPLGTFIYKAD